VAFLVVLAAVNLRGLKEAGSAFAAPTYLFAAGVYIMIITGLFRAAVGDAPVAETAKYGIKVQHGYGSLGVLALASSCCGRSLRLYGITGVEAIATACRRSSRPRRATPRRPCS